MIYYKHGTARSRKTIFGGYKMKLVEKKVNGSWITKLAERKVKGNWEIKIVGATDFVSTVYTLYVFDRTLRQFALIKKFTCLQEAKNYFNNLIKK